LTAVSRHNFKNNGNHGLSFCPARSEWTISFRSTSRRMAANRASELLASGRIFDIIDISPTYQAGIVGRSLRFQTVFRTSRYRFTNQTH
ncbi:MAG: hypothetical protein KKB37_00215, partial [Alphaproteobacteria bacterium]|nr:hypothetical protein [Alphaproteobacteria bacterium]